MAPLTLNGTAALLPQAISGPIFEQAGQTSVVMQLANRVPTTLTGTAIPVTVGRIKADWVDEGAEKHVSDAGVAVKTMVPKKVATIITVSEEFYRTNPGGLFDLLKEDAGEALGDAFDVAALLGKRTVGPGPGPFDTYVAQTTKQVDLGTAAAAEGGIDGDLSDRSGIRGFNGYALDETVRDSLVNARDTTGRRLVDDPSRIGGVPAVYGRAAADVDPTVAGFGGNWRMTAWGVGMDITVKVTDQATLNIGGTMTSLWQKNLVGLLVEAAYGFVVHQPDDHFVKYAAAPAV